MAKTENAKYAPGELSRVRERLGQIDHNEAKELAQKLGGEIGTERSRDDDAEKNRSGAKPPISRPIRRIEIAPEGDDSSGKKKSVKQKGINPLDDPSVPLTTSFFDRIKMDRLASQPEFEIKSPSQVIKQMLMFFADTPDTVSNIFINRRMPEYYKKIETLVTSTRNIFPRNNLKRNERLKKSSPLTYAILDQIRYWNIEKISQDLAKIQARPKNALVSDFTEIKKAIYRPLFLLEKMDSDNHIRGAYKNLYKAIQMESPDEAKNKAQDLTRMALAAFFEIRRDISFFMYPLLLKLVSSKYVQYSHFFTERRNRILAFLNLQESEILDASKLLMIGEVKEKKPGDESGAETESGEEANAGEQEDEISEEEKNRRAAKESEKKALERGYQALETLFPQAGWKRLDEFPDLYPYFVDIFDLKRGIINISPSDPMQQIFILMRILEELFFGLRSVSFGSVTGANGAPESIEETLGGIINGWRHHFEISFGDEYLPRLNEYLRILEGSVEERVSPYTRKLTSELHWIKRLYFMPYYKFESIGPPTIQKKDTEQIYTNVRTMRKYLTMVAAGIEQGNKAGGAAARAVCAGIDNPWDPYIFQIPNPVSIRLNALIPPKSRNNSVLIYFSLAVSTILDHLLNNENSWAYTTSHGTLYRTADGDGISPSSGVETKIDAEAIFKESIKQRQKKP